MGKFRFAVLATVVAGALASPIAASATRQEIYANDACSPSFNDTGAGHLCDNAGGMPFGTFAQLLMRNGFVGAWNFTAPRVHFAPGESIEVENRGGETHTLTPVTQFGGGGIVGPINELIFGTQTPPIFFDPAGPLNFVPPGGHIDIGPLSPGTHLLICVIHPWMHETITVG